MGSLDELLDEARIEEARDLLFSQLMENFQEHIPRKLYQDFGDLHELFTQTLKGVNDVDIAKFKLLYYGVEEAPPRLFIEVAPTLENFNELFADNLCNLKVAEEFFMGEYGLFENDRYTLRTVITAEMLPLLLGSKSPPELETFTGYTSSTINGMRYVLRKIDMDPLVKLSQDDMKQRLIEAHLGAPVSSVDGYDYFFKSKELLESATVKLYEAQGVAANYARNWSKKLVRLIQSEGLRCHYEFEKVGDIAQATGKTPAEISRERYLLKQAGLIFREQSLEECERRIFESVFPSEDYTHESFLYHFSYRRLNVLVSKAIGRDRKLSDGTVQDISPAIKSKIFQTITSMKKPSKANAEKIGVTLESLKDMVRAIGNADLYSLVPNRELREEMLSASYSNLIVGLLSGLSTVQELADFSKLDYLKARKLLNNFTDEGIVLADRPGVPYQSNTFTLDDSLMKSLLSEGLQELLPINNRAIQLLAERFGITLESEGIYSERPKQLDYFWLLDFTINQIIDSGVQSFAALAEKSGFDPRSITGILAGNLPDEAKELRKVFFNGGDFIHLNFLRLFVEVESVSIGEDPVNRLKEEFGIHPYTGKRFVERFIPYYEKANIITRAYNIANETSLKFYQVVDALSASRENLFEIKEGLDEYSPVPLTTKETVLIFQRFVAAGAAPYVVLDNQVGYYHNYGQIDWGPEGLPGLVERLNNPDTRDEVIGVFGLRGSPLLDVLTDQ